MRDERYKKESSMMTALKKYVNPYPKMEIEVDYEYIYEPKLLEIQDDFGKETHFTCWLIQHTV